MSKLDLVQLGSLPFNPTRSWTSFQQLGATTNFNTVPASMGKPATINGGASANPSFVYDNTATRSTTLLSMFAVVTADSNVAIRQTGYAKEPVTGLYLPTTFFLGAGNAGSFSTAATGQASSLAVDNFPTKTFASPFVKYIEPSDGLGFALLIVDIRGYDYVLTDLAQGSATASTYVQLWTGVN